jgi:hypothetical protein
MRENNLNISISDEYGNKISFLGSSNYTPIKFRRSTKQTLSAETREIYLGRSERLSVNITYINQEEFNKLKTIFYSSGKKTIRTERGEVFKMVFNSDELNLSNEYDSDTYEIFYFGSIEMVR